MLATMLGQPSAEAQFLDKLKEKVKEAVENEAEEAGRDALTGSREVVQGEIDCVASDGDCPIDTVVQQATAPALNGEPVQPSPAAQPDVPPATGAQPIAATVQVAAQASPSAAPAANIEVRPITLAGPDRSWQSDPAVIRFKGQFLVGRDLYDGATGRLVAKNFVESPGIQWRVVAGRPDLLFADMRDDGQAGLPGFATVQSSAWGWISRDGKNVLGTSFFDRDAGLQPGLADNFRRVVYLEDGDLWRAEVDWMAREVVNHEKVTNIGVLQGGPYGAKYLRWYGNTLLLKADLSQEKPLLKIDLASGAVEELAYLRALDSGSVNPSGWRSCSLVPGPSARDPVTLSCYDIRNGEVSELTIDHNGTWPALFQGGTGLLWIDDDTLVGIYQDQGCPATKASCLPRAGGIARVDFRTGQIENLFQGRVETENDRAYQENVLQTLEVLPGRRHIALDVMQNAPSKRSARKVRVAVEDGTVVELPGVETHGVWLDDEKFIYARDKGGLSEIGTWLYDVANGKATRVCNLPGYIVNQISGQQPVPYFSEYGTVFFLVNNPQRVMKVELPNGTCQEVVAAGNQAATMQLVKFRTPPVSLHLGLVDAARQDAAPALGRGASGLHVLKAFEEHSQEAGEPRHLVIAPDGTLFAAAARGGKYQQGLVFRIKADGSAYQVLYDFLGNRQDGSDPSSLMLGPEGWLYGTLSQGGQHGAGSLFRVRQDGTDFSALHHFRSGSRTAAALVTIAADGAVYGTSNLSVMAGSPGTLWRFEPGKGELAVIYQPADPTASAGRKRALEVQREAAARNVDMQKQQLEQIKQQQLPDSVRAQYIAQYTAAVEQAEAELQRIEAELAGMDGGGGPIGPMIDGGDGYFYGVARNTDTTTLPARHGIFRLTNKGTDYAVIHEFDGAPLDGDVADTPPVFVGDGKLYGIATTVPGGNGVLYGLDRDGTSYRVIVDPKAPLPFGAPIAGPDGSLYAIGAGEGPKARRVYRFAASDGAATVVGEFDVNISNALIQSLQFHDGDIFGLIIWGNGGGKLFRYVL